MAEWSSRLRLVQRFSCIRKRAIFDIFGKHKGGYNLDAISISALAVTRVLLGEAPDIMPPMTASEEATETVWQVAKEQSKYWKNVDPRACEPREGSP
jgi:hypothetical protein